MLKNFCVRLWNGQQGQDLVEYALMLAFVAAVSAALYAGCVSSVNVMWSSTNSELSTAAS